jgi:hypothetical protein
MLVSLPNFNESGVINVYSFFKSVEKYEEEIDEKNLPELLDLKEYILTLEKFTDILKRVKEKFEVENIQECAKKIIDLVFEVKQGDLYNKVSKFVGRLDSFKTNGKTYGTGFVVHWEKMPEFLKGRVIFGSGHLHPNANTEYEEISKLKWIENKEIGKIGKRKIFLTEEKLDGTKLSEIMYFTPDIDCSLERINIWGVGPLPQSIPAERCYVFGDENDCIVDFMVVILKERIGKNIGDGVDLGDLEKIPLLEEIKECFSIGYGRVIVYNLPKPIALLCGQGVKKKNLSSVWIFSDTFCNDEYCETNVMHNGPGDSGGPLIDGLRVVGVLNGFNNSISITRQVKRLNFITDFETHLHFGVEKKTGEKVEILKMNIGIKEEGNNINKSDIIELDENEKDVNKSEENNDNK